MDTVSEKHLQSNAASLERLWREEGMHLSVLQVVIVIVVVAIVVVVVAVVAAAAYAAAAAGT